MKRLLAVGFALVALTGFGDPISLSGEWTVRAEGIDAAVSLPGTLGGAKLGRRWTEEDFRTSIRSGRVWKDELELIGFLLGWLGVP